MKVTALLFNAEVVVLVFSIIGFSFNVLGRGNWWAGKLLIVHTDMTTITAQLKINYMAVVEMQIYFYY